MADDLILDAVVRRNRRRLLVVTGAAALNYWLIATLLLAFFVAGIHQKIWEDGPIDAALFWVACACVAAVIAALTVGWRLQGIRTRTVSALGAAEIKTGEVPVVENLLAGLAIATGTAPVRAALLADPAPNALAVGRTPQDTTVVVTSGLVESLTRDELEAVLAVEMCAIRRLDTALSTVTLGCTAGAVAAHVMFREDWKDPREWIFIAFTWPTMVVAEVMRRWVLRTVDFGADDMALSITRHPEALGRALRKLRADEREVRTTHDESAPLWFEPLRTRRRSVFRELRALTFSPSLDERLARLPHVSLPAPPGSAAGAPPSG